jgi:hypothetical protein
MQANVYTRERKHKGSRVPNRDPYAKRKKAHRERKHYKQINQQYNKYYLMTKKTVPANDTHHYEHVDARIIQIGATIKRL